MIAMQTVIDPITRVFQFAELVLEFGGALAIALLFVVIGRYGSARSYLRRWTIGWLAASVGIAAVAARYVLLGSGANGVPDTAWVVRALYVIYQTGKVSYWMLVCLGALEYARPAHRPSRWWLVAAVAYGGITGLYPDLSIVLVWQAPVVVATCVAGAFTLLDLPRPRRSVGSIATGAVLAATAALWVTYFIAFASARQLIPDVAPALAGTVTRFNSYLDMLMIVVLGYAMIVLFMEDVRLRSSEAETRLAALVATTAEAIVTVDDQLLLVDANAAAERMFGFARDSARGRSLDTLVQSDDAGRLRTSLDPLRRGGASSLALDGAAALHGVRADGTAFPCELSASLLRAGGETAIALVLRDATARREAEERRLQASKMDAVRQLAGGLAHDFNDLLTAIVGRSQILGRSLTADSPTRQAVEEIEHTASAAARLTHGLLALSHMEPLHSDHLPANALVRALEVKVRAVAGPSVAVECRYAGDIGDVHVDVGRFDEVVLSIVQNAREAMGNAGGRLIVETSHLAWQRAPPVLADSACITIRDSGPGLSAEARLHLFEPFFSTKGEGRGLGLATAYAFVQQSGGSLDVQSSSYGTTVRIALPLVGARPGALAEAPLIEQAVAGSGQRPRVPTVLVAEDEDTVRRFVRIVLEQEGFRVLEATNGVEALGVFAAADPSVDVLLTDIVMPLMGGAELAEKLHAVRPGLRVILMSGFVRDVALRHPATGRPLPFLQKPFDIADLSRVVRAEMPGS
jgi:PAS domain S-box-containing protein